MDTTTTADADLKSFKTFAEFRPFYPGEHRNRTGRRLHFVGSTLAPMCLGILAATGRPWELLHSLLCGYGFARIGHSAFEKNEPVSFKRSLCRWLGDCATRCRDMWRRRIPL